MMIVHTMFPTELDTTMTTNHDHAIDVIGTWIDNNLPHDETLFGADEGITEALADENLITADKVVLDKADRDFVIDTLNNNIRSAQFWSLTGMVEAWRAAANAFITHTTTATDDDSKSER